MVKITSLNLHLLLSTTMKLLVISSFFIFSNTKEHDIISTGWYLFFYCLLQTIILFVWLHTYGNLSLNSPIIVFAISNHIFGLHSKHCRDIKTCQLQEFCVIFIRYHVEMHFRMLHFLISTLLRIMC